MISAHHHNMCPVPSIGTWPWGDGFDPELERLRRLEQRKCRERKKEAIRRRLREMGVPEHEIQGGRWPSLPPNGIRPLRPCSGGLPNLESIIEIARSKAKT